MTHDAQGWSIRPHAVIGKTEVLCTDEKSLRILKHAAEGIPASEIYPSFEAAFSHTLFFFDVRPEFVLWVRESVSQIPAPAMRAAESPAPRRRLPAAAAIAFFLLLGLCGAFAVLRPEAPAVAMPVEPAPAAATAADAAEDTGAGEPTIRTIVYTEAPPVAASSRAVGGGRLDLWFVDVGQGDGIVLRLPGGDFVLVDANSGADDEIMALLEKLGCRGLKAIVMSHPHLDHIGGMPAILAKYKVGTFYDPGKQHTTAIYRKVLEAVERNGCDYVQPETGEKLAFDPAIGVTVLNADRTAGEINNASIVLKIDFGGTSVILTGDAEKEAERSMVERFPGRLAAQLLKVGHHGSRSSSTGEFLKEVKPEIAVISCAEGNSYKHPHPETLKRYEAAGTRIFRTDLQGTIHAQSNGTAWSVSAEGGR